jgi:hypothetical protein
VKGRVVHDSLWVCAITIILLLLGYLFLVLTGMGANDRSDLVHFTGSDLHYARHCIRTFKKDVGRFPKSVQELYEYGKRIPEGDSERLHWRFPFMERISRNWRTEGAREHAKLDGSGGLFYNPENGDIKVNLTKPLRYYWRGYSGGKQDEIPADW